ncbi:MAG: hypothetical protein EOO61_11660 [Hymenobacter sp.]|nr:MAG: hypothetical protein EOO61_11660 [Hymenobacter sp.]
MEAVNHTYAVRTTVMGPDAKTPVLINESWYTVIFGLHRSMATCLYRIPVSSIFMSQTHYYAYLGNSGMNSGMFENKNMIDFRKW